MENLTILFSGYGHWKIITTHYGKEIYTITTDAHAVSDAKDGKKYAIKLLRRDIIQKNKTYKGIN